MDMLKYLIFHPELQIFTKQGVQCTHQYIIAHTYRF